MPVPNCDRQHTGTSNCAANITTVIDNIPVCLTAGMYASQIWATPYLRQGKEMDNPVQKWLLTVLKRTLRVRDTTPSWCIMRECGLILVNLVNNSGDQGHYSLLVHHARMWSGALTIQLVPSSNASLQLLDPMQQLHNEKDFAG
eukprot:1161761-Pelagomonas_calceolata.AAC.12